MRRMGARVVDALIVLLLIAGTGVVTLMIGVSPVGTALLVAVGYEVGLVRWRGQTVGKMVVGIEVLQAESGRPLGWRDAAVRCLVLVTPFVLPHLVPHLLLLAWWFGVVVAFSAKWHPGRQGWHDRAARSVVVVAERRQTASALGQVRLLEIGQERAAGLGAVAASPLVGVWGKSILVLPLLVWYGIEHVDRSTLTSTLARMVPVLLLVTSRWLPSRLRRWGVGGSVVVLLYPWFPDLSRLPRVTNADLGSWYAPFLTPWDLALDLIVGMLDIAVGGAVLMLVASVLIVGLRHRAIVKYLRTDTTIPDGPEGWSQRLKARGVDLLGVLVLIWVLGRWWGISYVLWVQIPVWAFVYETVQAAVSPRWGTIGKRLMALRVVTMHGTDPSRWQAYARALALYGPVILLTQLAITVCSLLGVTAEVLVPAVTIVTVWVMVLHPQGRGFHDLLAETRVVDVAAKGQS